MIGHDKVESEVQFLEWQYAAWKRISERNPAEVNFVYQQLQQIAARINILKEWDGECWFLAEEKQNVYV